MLVNCVRGHGGEMYVDACMVVKCGRVHGGELVPLALDSFVLNEFHWSGWWSGLIPMVNHVAPQETGGRGEGAWPRGR